MIIRSNNEHFLPIELPLLRIPTIHEIGEANKEKKKTPHKWDERRESYV